MAGGITTAKLISETSKCGGLGSLGAGYMKPEEIGAEINRIRELTSKPFGINLFVPSPNIEADPVRVNHMKAILSKFKDVLQLEQELPALSKDYSALFHKQVEEILKARVPVCSFTFGIPEEAVLQELKKQECAVIGTATNVREAVEWEQAGADMIVAQGSEAGGHRGTFHGEESELIGLMALVPQIVGSVKIPVIAAGGIMDGRGAAASFMLGAQGAQLGTAFITCEESGAHPAYKQALINASEDDTVLTKSFSGRLARGMRNVFIEEMAPYEDEVPPFPLQNELTGVLRKQAAALNNKEYMSLWAGQAVPLARKTTVAELMASLIQDINALM